ncbi:hypothetical protein F5Y04DRAFT_276909 [Hypomontagnella monticulosa]|nr:hypothetical protein F5Y04DRAFT_276909 [Hypomontagnella monticulosa]
MESNQPKRHPLPTEIILQIIHQAIAGTGDYMLPHVWYNFRGVSKLWQVETEKLLMRKHLPSTTIRIRERPGSHLDPINLTFDRVEEANGRQRVVFTAIRETDDYFEETRRFKNLIAAQTWKPYRPFYDKWHQVTVRNVATGDPPLEELRLDEQRREVSMLLHPMLGQLFGVELQLRRRARDLYELAHGAEPTPDPMTKKMQIWLLQRDMSFRKEIADLREARLCPLFESIEGHSRIVELSYLHRWYVNRSTNPVDEEPVNEVWKKRKSFNTPMELVDRY